MVSAFQLLIDITAPDINLSEKKFRALLAPSISYLHALKGAFDKREQCAVFFYPPDPESENSNVWSARCVVMISVGQERGKSLLELYEAVANLIMFELPDFGVRAEMSEMKFS